MTFNEFKAKCKFHSNILAMNSKDRLHWEAGIDDRNAELREMPCWAYHEGGHDSYIVFLQKDGTFLGFGGFCFDLRSDSLEEIMKVFYSRH